MDGGMRTLTERIAKRIRRGQPWNRLIPDDLILKWSRQYSVTSRYHRLGLLNTDAGVQSCIRAWDKWENV